MATDNSSMFNNAYPGQVETFGGNIYRLDTTPKYALGFRISRMDGSIYRYCQYGAVTTRGLIVSQDISETSIPDTNNTLTCGTASVSGVDGNLGSRFVQVLMSSQIANNYAGGYFMTTDDTGEGYTYRIKGNTASTYSGTNGFRIELYEPLQVAVDATTDFAIVGCMYNNVEAATQGTEGAAVGVSCATTTAAKPFAFAQTRGVVGVYQDASTITVAVPGSMAQLSVLTAGNVGVFLGGSVGTTAADVSATVVGYFLDQGDSTGVSTIYLQLE